MTVPEGMLEAMSRNMAFSYRTLAQRAGRRAIVDEATSLADQGVQLAITPNNVTLLRPGHDPEALVRRADAFYGARRYQVWSVWGIDLARLGFTRTTSPGMIRPPGDLPPLPSGIDVREVTEQKEMVTFERTLVEGFPLANMREAAPGTLIHPRACGDARLRFWLAWIDGRAVATAWSAVSDGYVGVYGVATREEVRRRGCGAAVTLAAIAAMPDLPATLQSSAAGRSLYEKLGFREVAAFEVWRPTKLPDGSSS